MQRKNKVNTSLLKTAKAERFLKATYNQFVLQHFVEMSEQHPLLNQCLVSLFVFMSLQKMQSWYNVSKQKQSFSPEELSFAGVCLFHPYGWGLAPLSSMVLNRNTLFASDFKVPKQEDFPLVLSNRKSHTD